ncbi:MAG: signal recognition particle-docking protein FtsY [bacterium]|nr:signal recognition particle-docking protein FtsY [bacterium]
MSLRDRLSARLSKSRQRLNESMNILFQRGAKLDDSFWDNLEETLILSDMGPTACMELVEELRDETRRQAIPDAESVRERLISKIVDLFVVGEADLFDEAPAVILFVGINGAGKTTTVGKLAKSAVDDGHSVLLGSADTFRAAAIEQLDEWAARANVDVVKRERGSDPASVCFEAVERGEQVGSDFVLIDTAGRLHTSDDLMRELQKVVGVTRKRSRVPVKVVLVIDATTGQNGLEQAKVFNKALDLDAVIVTKLDGTAKGGIAVAISNELQLPIVRIGIGESIDDLGPFEPRDFVEALLGAQD